MAKNTSLRKLTQRLSPEQQVARSERQRQRSKRRLILSGVRLDSKKFRFARPKLKDRERTQSELILIAAGPYARTNKSGRPVFRAGPFWHNRAMNRPFELRDKKMRRERDEYAFRMKIREEMA